MERGFIAFYVLTFPWAAPEPDRNFRSPKFPLLGENALIFKFAERDKLMLDNPHQFTYGRLSRIKDNHHLAPFADLI